MKLLVCAVALAGCVDVGEDAELLELKSAESALTSANGISLNGISLNGISLNGVSLNGVSLNGISLNGVALNGVAVNGVALNGATLPAAGVVNSTWTGTLSSGATIQLRIDSATRGAGTLSDVGMYGVSYRTSTSWTRLCGSNADGTPILALAVPGTWDPRSGVVGGGAYTASTTTFTFACRAKSIAKCVEMGYRPWAGRSTQLASCVRALRADYCGNGTPYTVDGTRINIFDNIGVQLDTEAWTAEAEWTPAGARCIGKPMLTRWSQQGKALPPCATQLTSGNSCGFFGAGAVLVTELP